MKCKHFERRKSLDYELLDRAALAALPIACSQAQYLHSCKDAVASWQYIATEAYSIALAMAIAKTEVMGVAE